MDKNGTYDCIIIGGGIAGLCLSIQLARKKLSVLLLEKNAYPFHKVCGEYVSNESRSFLKELGLPLEEWSLPDIRYLGISSSRGFMMQSQLQQGGFGLSRFKLDHELALLARKAGVELLEHCKVTDVRPGEVISNKGVHQGRLIAGTFGKSTPLFAHRSEKQNGKNYIGVKYHIRTDFPSDRIELHNFKGGYCGISKVEAERYCLCYLSDSENLKNSGNSIEEMEMNFLRKNPRLEHIFSNAEILFEKPVTISNISFSMKQTHDQRLFYLGDAAGCISPLTGNGMSMAARTSQFASGFFADFLSGKLSFDQLSETYDRTWKMHFEKQIRRGKQLQYLFGKDLLSHYSLKFLEPFTGLKNSLIRSTHGTPF